MDGVGFNQVLAGFVVAFGLDSLDFGQEFCEEGAELYVVVDHKVGLAVAYLLLDDVILGAFLVAPFGYELAVLHMGFGVGTAGLHTGELDHETVADVVGVFGLVGLGVGHNAQLYHLGIGGVVETKEVCAGLFQGRSIFTHRGGAYSGEELAGAVAQALVEVGVDFIGQGSPLLGQFYLFLIIGELGEGAGGHLLGAVIVGVGDVGNGHGLGAVLLADPVGIGQVDANGRGRIAVTGQANGIDDLGADTLHGLLLEAGVHRGVILEPLGVGGQDLRALGGLEVLDVHVAFPGTLAAEGVIVVLYKTVDEVHRADGVLNPFNIEGVPLAEVSGLVIFYKECERALLDIVLSNLASELQFFANLGDSRGVDTTHLPGELLDFSVLSFYHLGIQTIRDGLGI